MSILTKLRLRAESEPLRSKLLRAPSNSGGWSCGWIMRDRRLWLVAALICLLGFNGCGDDDVAQLSASGGSRGSQGGSSTRGGKASGGHASSQGGALSRAGEAGAGTTKDGGAAGATSNLGGALGSGGRFEAAGLGGGGETALNEGGAGGVHTANGGAPTEAGGTQAYSGAAGASATSSAGSGEDSGGSGPACAALSVLGDWSQASFGIDGAIFSAFVSPDFGSVGPDEISLEEYDPSVGTFELGVGEDANYVHCGQCLLLSISGEPARRFLATAGTLTISQDSRPTTDFIDATVTDATFGELDEESGTVIPDSSCFRLAATHIRVLVQPSP